MRVLITGGAGYVGTSLIPLLLEQGHTVRVLDNLMFGGDQLLPCFRHATFEFMKGDIRDPEDVRQATHNQDAVIHLAAIVGYPACRKNPDLADDVNVGGARNLAAHLSRGQVVLLGSTGSIYGEVIGICSENTPLRPLSHYGQTKQLAEQHLREHCTTIAYRFATGFGLSPRMRLDLLINDLVHKALTQQYLVVYEQQFMRTFIHVRDMGQAFLFGLEHANQMVGQVYNVGSEQLNYSKRAICELIQQHIKCYVHYANSGEDADKRNYEVSYQKIGAIGYRTSITVEDGIAELVRGIHVLNGRTLYSNA